MLVYLLDSNNIYAGTKEVDPMGALPSCATTPPPETSGTEVAQCFNGNWSILPKYPQQDYTYSNKETATLLLQQTDWTATVDIADPQYSNPHLANQSEFLTYRSLVRQIVLNPPTTPATFPDLPVEQWS